MSIETGFKGLQLQSKALTQSAEKGWQSGGMALPFAFSDSGAGDKGRSFAALLQSSTRQPERPAAPAPAPDRPAQRDDRASSASASARQEAARRDERPQESRAARQRSEDSRRSDKADDARSTADTRSESTSGQASANTKSATGSESATTGPFSEELTALVNELPAEELSAAFSELSALAEDAEGLTLEELNAWLEENSELLQQTVELFSHVPTEELQAMLDEAGVSPESPSMLQAILAFSELEPTPELEAAGATEAGLAELLGVDGELGAAFEDVSNGMQQLAAHIAVLPEDGATTMDAEVELPAGLMASADPKATASGQPVTESAEDEATAVDGLPPTTGAGNKPAGESLATNERLMFAQMLASREGAAADAGASVRPAAGQLTPLAAAVAGPAQPGVSAEQAGKPLLPFQTSLQSSINDSFEWKEQFQQKLSWFLKEGIQSARLQLNPVDMGPIDVRIQVQKDQAQIHVFAQNQQVREMLENTSGRLREMLAGQNIDLSGFDVSSQSRDGQTGQRSGEQGSGGYGGTTAPVTGEPELEAAEVLIGSQHIRLVDQYV